MLGVLLLKYKMSNRSGRRNFCEKYGPFFSAVSMEIYCHVSDKDLGYFIHFLVNKYGFGMKSM